jgi:hypothetical protein
MDRNIEKLQMVNGFKLVVDNHPFMGKSEIYWSYFLWSFFDRSLLGYPHCYAFRTALKKSSVDCQSLALKVLSKTETTIEKIFKDDIIVQRFSLDIDNEYLNLKEKLFNTENSSRRIIKELKRFVNKRCPDLRKGFDLITFSRIFEQYQKGLRILALSNQKIDDYLNNEFWAYIKNVNTFTETLWKNQ